MLAAEPAMAADSDPGEWRVTPRGRNRLRYQLDSVADRRRLRTGSCATCTARCASCGSARASTRPGSSRRRRLQRTRSALVDYANLCTAHGVDRIRMVATSAARDVGNRDVFFAMTAEVLGAVVDGAVAEVITGAEEAELSFRGAVSELDCAAGAFRHRRPGWRLDRDRARAPTRWWRASRPTSAASG